MRHALSLLTGIAVAVACVVLLRQAASLSPFALGVCGLGICLVTRAWAHNLPALRRAAVRLRIRWRRHVPNTFPDRAQAAPLVRAQIGRMNPLWLACALVAGWTFYEFVDGISLTAAPIERAAAGASSAIDAVAGTSAAIRALSAVGDVPASREVAGGVGVALPQGSALAQGSDGRRLASPPGNRGQVMGAPAAPRTGESGCATSSILGALLPERRVKEL